MKLTMRATALGKRITLLTTAFVLAVSSLTALTPFLLSKQAHADPGIVTVTSGNMNGWVIKNQDPANVSGSFVGGPSGMGLTGIGSYQVSSPNGTKLIAYNPSVYNQHQKLSDFTQLGYSTYVDSRSTGTKVAPALDIIAVINGTWTTLVYEPTYTNDNTATGQWQSWNALEGKWWSTKDLKDSSNNVVVHAFNDYVPWSTITSLDANASLSSDGDVSGVQVVVGQNSGGSPWSNFEGSFDDVNINGTMYDFEPTPPAVPSNLHFIQNGRPLTCGGATKTQSADIAWNAASNAVSYNYRSWTTAAGSPYNSEATAYVSSHLTSTSISSASFNQGDGIYYAEVQAVDANGLTSSWSPACGVTYDTNGPVVTITNPAANTTVSNDGALKITGTVSDSLSVVKDVYLRVTDTAVRPSNVLNNVQATIDEATHTWSYTVSPHTLQNGHAVQITAYARDVLNNQNQISVENVTIDSSSPSIEFVSPTPEDNSVLNHAFDVKVNATDNDKLKTVDASLFSTNADGTLKDWVAGCGSANNINMASYTLGCSVNLKSGYAPHAALPDGSYILRATTQDTAGNWGTLNRLITIDTTRPKVTFTSPVVNHTYGNPLTVSGSATDKNGIKDGKVTVVLRYMNPSGSMGANIESKQVVVNGDGTWSTTFTVNTLDDTKQYGVQVLAYDNANNESNGGSGQAVRPFNIDVTPPSVISFDYSNNHGSALTNANVTVTMQSSEPIITPDGWNRVDDTHFTREYADNGKYTVSISDYVGNSGVGNFEVKRIDRQAPVINGIADRATVRGTVTLSISDPKYQGYDGFDQLHGLNVDGNDVATTYNGTDKTYTYSVEGDGQHTVTATDKAGNATTLRFTINNGISSTASAQDDSLTPVISGRLTYDFDGTTPVSNAEVRIMLDNVPINPDVMTNAAGEWTVGAVAANGPHIVEVALVNPNGSTTVLKTIDFTTSVAVSSPGGQQAAGDGSGDGGSGSASTGGTPAFTSPANGLAAVLGTSTTGNTNDPASDPSTQDVKGTSTENQPASATDQLTNTDGKAFGLAWYWWLLIVAAAAAIIWWIASAIRNRQPQA